MSIELPDELVWAIDMIGLPWPSVDEDQLRAFATHLRTYASSMSETHGAAHARIGELSADYSGPSYEALAERWAQASSSHMTALMDGCHVFADALDVAADAVTVQKGVIIAALAAMAAEFAAEQAAAIVTFGLAEFANAAIVGTTEFIVREALSQLEQQVLGAVLQAAIGPIEDRIAAAVQGMVLRGVQSVLT
jgi:hypothetical protein